MKRVRILIGKYFMPHMITILLIYLRMHLKKIYHWIKESVSTDAVERIDTYDENDLDDLLKEQVKTLENQSKVLQKYIHTLIKN